MEAAQPHHATAALPPPPSEAYTVIRLTALTLPDAIDDPHAEGTDDVVFLPQRSTQDTADLMHAAVVLDFNSFDGGEWCAGRLREGGPESVPLFSRECVGLAVSAAVAGFCVAFFGSAFRPLFISGYLSKFHGPLIATTSSLLQWPPELSLFVGVLSDAVPIGGYHRQPSSWPAGCSSRSRWRPPRRIVASLGIQVVWVVSLAITVEHAQRETAKERGHFLGAFFLVYYSVTVLTHTLCTRLLVKTNEDGTVETVISLQETVVVLAATALLPIPFVLCLYHEHRGEYERGTASKRSTIAELGTGPDTFWTHLQQKPAHRIYCFLCGVAFLVNARNDTVDAALLSWCGVAKHKFGNLTVAQAMPKVVVVIVWKWFMLNANWRVLGVAGLALHALCKLALVVTGALGAGRGEEWLFYTWTAVASIPLGWVEVFMVTLPTEVAGIGYEGITMGLVASFMALISIMATTLWDSINTAAGLTFSAQEIAADSAATRQRLALVGSAYVVLNLSSVALAPLLPPQKRDAQLWRAFGRANRPAAHSLAGAFVVLALYNLVANWLQVRRA